MFLRSFNQIKTGKLTLSSTAQKLALQHIFPVQFGSADKIYAVGSGDVIIAEYF